MKAFGTARLGSDMEVRFLPNGDPVGDVSLAFRLGKKDKAGEYMTQWIKASLFGKRAESLAPYLKKGTLHAFVLRDIHLDEYTDRDGMTKASLKAMIDDVELCGKPEGSSAPSKRHEPSPRGGGASGFDDMDDDIPF